MSKVDNFLFTKEHEWVSIDDEMAIIGITDFAQNQLVNFVQKVAQNLPNFGKNTIVFNFSEPLKIGRYHKSAEYFFQRSAQIPRIPTVKILRFQS